MNKKNISFLSMAAALTVAGLSGCSEEQTLPVGEGTMYLSTRVNSDVVVESRATLEEELGASTVVWIYSDQGVVRKYNGINEVPTSGIKLISGTYTVKAWAGTAEYASFDNRWFEGSEVVEITPDQPKAVEVVCKIANVVASVKPSENIGEFISDYTLTVSHKGGSLTFEGNEENKLKDERKGYYMMPEGVTALDYVLTFTTDGQEKTVRGTIDDVEPGHEYVFNVKADNGNSEADNGAAFITIEVDETTIDVVDSSVLITVPPAITGYGFDLSAPVAGESGSIGRKSVYVSATSALKSVALTGITGIEGFAEVDLVRASEDVLTSLASKGISREVQNVEGGQMIKIIFEDAYLNTLANREEAYVINISATDSNDKTTTAALTLRITEAPVVTAPVAEESISYAAATLTGSVAKDGVERVGFEYALANTEDWTYVEGAASRAGYTKGQTYYATVSGLEVGAEYKYRAVSGTATEITFRADEEKFTTVAGPQLPNAGMEGWYTKDGVTMPMNNGAEGWDSGNHGAKLASTTLTRQTASMKHGGNYGAELKTQFASVFGIGKLAAGNLFYGQYLKTDGTDGIIGFGRPFNFPQELKMTKLRLWVKYVPKPATSNGDGSHVPVGTNDTGHIFVALFDGSDNGDATYNPGAGYDFGFVVRTKNGSRLFDKHASNVVAYGEHVFTEATAGDGLVMLEIPLEYYAGKGAPTHIAIVCTASKYGDYFEGGEGSTMYVDDFELVYKAL